jgi:hypothetical protein
VRARQPHLVLPVAAVPRGSARGVAGGGRRPARHGLLRTPGTAAHPRAADRRPHGGGRRAGRHRTGRHGGARLGRGDLARLGAGPPRPRARRRPRQHRRPPARGCGRAVADPAGPHPGAAARGLHGHAHVRAGHRRPVPPRPARRRARRAGRALRHGGPAARRRRVRRRHPARSRARQRADAGRHRGRSPGAGRRARAAPVGAPRPRLLRPLPARPARAVAARARPPLRASLAPRHRRRPRQRGRHLALAAEPGRGFPAAAAGIGRPAAGLGRVGGARGRPGRRRGRAGAAPTDVHRVLARPDDASRRCCPREDARYELRAAPSPSHPASFVGFRPPGEAPPGSRDHPGNVRGHRTSPARRVSRTAPGACPPTPPGAR